MAKKLYDAMISELIETLGQINFDLISLTQGTKEKEDGTTEQFFRAELEIPKGYGTFSRCRFSCKFPFTNFQISEDDIENGVSVSVNNLQITFISTNKEIYAKADSLEIVSV